MGKQVTNGTSYQVCPDGAHIEPRHYLVHSKMAVWYNDKVVGDKSVI